MLKFGFETKGSSSSRLAANYIAGPWFFCSENGVAQSITVYLVQYLSDIPKIKAAIYKKSDNSLVGYTEEWVLTIGWDGWKTFNVIWGGSLEATNYYLVIWSTSFVTYYYESETGKGGTQNRVYNNFPNSWTPGPFNRKVSIYCTYTSAPAGWKNLQYFSEPPTSGQFNKLRFASEPPVSGAWNKVLYEGE